MDDGMSSCDLDEHRFVVYGGTIEGLKLTINKRDFNDVK